MSTRAPLRNLTISDKIFFHQPHIQKKNLKKKKREREMVVVEVRHICLFYFHKFGLLKLLEMKGEMDNKVYLLLIMFISCILSSSAAQKSAT